MNTACPSRAELAEIGTGAFAGSCPPGMATHIEGCAECREFLKRSVEDGLASHPWALAGLPTPDALPRIDGFIIERELGRGAMGVVYLARRDTPRRQVALKLLPGGRLAGPRERRHWLREAEAASLVRHPNVVTLYEVDEVDDWFLLALEYIPGGTLADRLSEPLAPRDAGRLMQTIARAVHHIHQCGQLHLDLKPSNILLDGEAVAGWDAVIPKVSDFGIARTAEAGATDTGGPGAGGTPSYMAPEQITKARNDMTARADIHGLGAILYHMLTGRPPYLGATILETIDLVQRQDPLPTRRLNPKIPSDLETICLKCLEKDPARRYPSAELLADDLGRWLNGRPISARPASPVEKTWRWCRRRPVIAALAAALMLTFSVGFAAAILLWRQAEAARAQAETNFRMSNEVLTDLVYLTTGGDNGSLMRATLDRAIPRVEDIRKRLAVLSTSQPEDLVIARNLAYVEFYLAGRLQQTRRREDAFAVLLESEARLGVLVRQHPLNNNLRGIHISELRLFAELSEAQGRTDDSINYLARAIQSSEAELRVAPDAEGFNRLVANRRTLAWTLFSRGDYGKSRSLLAANYRLLENLTLECENLNLPLERMLAHIDLKLMADRSPSEPVAAVDAHEAGKGPLSALASPADASQSPENWATLAALVLRSTKHSDPATAARCESECTLNVMEYLRTVASRFNRAGKLEGARRIAEKMLALAKYFVESYPGEPNAHLALSLAYIQVYKNASRIEDQAAVATNMKSAEDAAQFALNLDPNYERAQQAIQSLRKRLADLHAKQ